MSISQKLLEIIAVSHQRVRAPRRVLVAVSGGLDSVCLLWLLSKLQTMDLGVAHVNHGLRGRMSDDDEKFTSELAQKLGLPFYHRRVDVKTYAHSHKLSLEAAGHILRHNFFLQVAKREGYESIATAHTLDDLAETVLMNLALGAGIKGLSGISPDQPPFWRPLLGVEKEELRQLARAEGITWREDLSNTDLRYLRNTWRTWLQQWSLLNKKQLVKAAEAVAGAAAELWKLAEKEAQHIEKQEVTYHSESKILFGMPTLNRYFSPALKALFDKVFMELSGAPQGLNAHHFTAVQKLLSPSAIAKQADLPGGIKVVRDRSGLAWVVPAKLVWKAQEKWAPFTWAGPGFKVQAVRKTMPQGARLKTSRWTQWIPGGQEPLVIRPWQSGDRIRPFSGTGSVKVSDLLQSARVAPHFKPYYPVIEYQGQIIWVPGIRAAEAARVKARARELSLLLTFEVEKGILE